VRLWRGCLSPCCVAQQSLLRLGGTRATPAGSPRAADVSEIRLKLSMWTVVSSCYSYSQGVSAAAFRAETRPNAKHSPIFPVPWYK
jgi:hypothetical protein